MIDQRRGLVKALIVKEIRQVDQMLFDKVQLLGIVLHDDKLNEKRLEWLMYWLFHGRERFGTKNFDMKMKFNFKLKVNFQTYFELMMLTSCICDKWIVLQTDMSTHEVHVTALAGGCHTRDLEPKCDNAMP